MERDAAVARGVLVAAFEEVARIAEQPRPRRHQTTAPRGSVGEGPGDDPSDGDPRMPLIEGTVPGAGGADHVLHRPSFAPGQQVGGGPSRRSGGGTPGERLLQIGRTFSQDAAPSVRYHAPTSASPRRVPNPPEPNEGADHEQ